tara:strand:+ start:247 stop:492 length:246 start_codon:yes stop_codon:yes gene_type:complete
MMKLLLENLTQEKLEEILNEKNELIKLLLSEIEELKDENGSVWDMLEEIKAADIATEKAVKQFQQDILIAALADTGPVGEA